MPDPLWHYAGYTLALAAAILTLRALFADRPKGRKRCRKCWYDLAAHPTLPITCPECGTTHTKPNHLTRTRPRKRYAALGLVLLVASYALWTTPRVIDRGWYGAVPTTALIVAAPWLPEPLHWSAYTHGSLPHHPFVWDRYALELRERCNALPVQVAGIAVLWFELFESDSVVYGDMSSRFTRTITTNFIASRQLPEAMLESRCKKIVHDNLSRIQLAGATESATESKWTTPPRVDLSPFELPTIPLRWVLSWRRTALDGLNPRRFAIHGGDGPTTFKGAEAAWAEGTVQYDVELESTKRVVSRWRVTYEVVKVGDAGTRYAGFSSLHGFEVRCLPVKVELLPPAP